ncbi:hypothetical protein [Pseudoduganella chitinolytica]|uniref:Uncharacterized protein n=1 Tax=Pseudoduganella chitinolytica TaxID=34070 RepID=A0ABY8BHP3_9BURK|nr:hypothetical protein [Pseudoduganella chitinolytica]WEF34883.1 hypothetical protein PX653_09025 [Pseudoduganella chitinolytica]
MITYEVAGPTETGDYLIGYPTPGSPAVFTVASTASCMSGAVAQCARMNEQLVGARGVSMKRAIDFLAVDLGVQAGDEP